MQSLFSIHSVFQLPIAVWHTPSEFSSPTWSNVFCLRVLQPRQSGQFSFRCCLLVLKTWWPLLAYNWQLSSDDWDSWGWFGDASFPAFVFVFLGGSFQEQKQILPRMTPPCYFQHILLAKANYRPAQLQGKKSLSWWVEQHACIGKEKVIVSQLCRLSAIVTLSCFFPCLHFPSLYYWSLPKSPLVKWTPSLKANPNPTSSWKDWLCNVSCSVGHLRVKEATKRTTGK